MSGFPDGEIGKKIKIGMHFRSNINNREIEILAVTADYVQYCDMMYGTVFKLDRADFEKCDLEEVSE